jgi:hypothetical protein
VSDLPKFSPWRGDTDLHNQLNRLVVKTQDAIQANAAAIAKLKVVQAAAPTVVVQQGSGGVGDSTNIATDTLDPFLLMGG